MDYVNFKGEGVNPTERYRGQGWGLLQVLEAMPATGAPLPGFVKAADQVLTRRVANSPRARNESQVVAGLAQPIAKPIWTDPPRGIKSRCLAQRNRETIASSFEATYDQG